MQNTTTFPVCQQHDRHYACQEDVGCSHHYIFYNTFRVHFRPPKCCSRVMCWEPRDGQAADHEHEARREQTKETLCRFFKESTSTDEQAIYPSGLKWQMLLYLIKREAAKERKQKMRETGHPHDAMEKDFMNIFHFKNLNEVSHAVQTQGLFQVYSQRSSAVPHSLQRLTESITEGYYCS
ncbi:uncharacterized protein LOC135099950 isoform X2 [Scylla paramamosain]|uniref:uncharacterized protein LOC135099950 isoform X2 n=1 Tax=Scylla paramamosain TaxID=85552 RepID=UPI00308368FB